MAMPSNQIPQNASEMVLNLARALGLEIEIKGSQEAQEPQKKKHKGRKLPKVLSREEIATIFGALNTKTRTGLRNYVALLLMYRCGLRVSEVCNLSVSDVNFTTAQIYCQQAKGAKDRYVSMDKETIEWCQKWLAIRPEKAGTYFFSAVKGTPLQDRYLRTVCERLSEKTGIYLNDNHTQKPIHPHTFRHCYATELIEEGYSIVEVANLMGHDNITTTQCYAHCRQGELGKKIRERKSIIPQ